MLRNKIAYLTGILILTQFCISCSSYRSIKNTPDIISTEVKIGSKVKITTKDAKIYFLKTTKITDTHIHGTLLARGGTKATTEVEHGKVISIPYTNIRYIKKGKFNPIKTGAAVGAAGAAWFYFVIIPVLVAALLGG